jgi:hypothetical protein
MNPIVQVKLYGIARLGAERGKRIHLTTFETSARAIKRLKPSIAKTHAEYAPLQFSRNQIVRFQ